MEHFTNCGSPGESFSTHLNELEWETKGHWWWETIFSKNSFQFRSWVCSNLLYEIVWNELLHEATQRVLKKEEDKFYLKIVFTSRVIPSKRTDVSLKYVELRSRIASIASAWSMKLITGR